MRQLDIPVPPLEEQELIVSKLDQSVRDEVLAKHESIINKYKDIVFNYITGKQQVTDILVKMKDSGVDWIGQIPEDWGVKKISDITTFAKSGGTPSSKNENFYSDDGTPWVAIGDMSDTPIVRDTVKHLTQAGIKDKRLQIYPVGTLLYSMYATIGKVAELAIPATVNQAILAFGIKDGYNKDYIKMALRAFEPHAYEIASNTSQYNLNMEKVLNITIPIPPLEIQNQIATKLDALIGEFITGQKLVPGYTGNSERERE